MEDVTISRRLLISCRKMLLTCRIFFFRVAIFFIFPSKNFFHDKGKGQVCIWKHGAILHSDRPRSGPVFTKGWQYFTGQNQPRKREYFPISTAAQVFTKPSVLLNSLRRLFDVFQQVPRLTVQQGTKPLYVLPGQPLALPQLLKRGLT